MGGQRHKLWLELPSLSTRYIMLATLNGSKTFYIKNKSVVRMDIDAIVYHGTDSGILNIAQCSRLSSESYWCTIPQTSRFDLFQVSLLS